MKPKHLLLALLLPFALIAAACSDDDDSGEGSDDSDAAAEEATESEAAQSEDGGSDDTESEDGGSDDAAEAETVADDGDTTSPGTNMGSPITGDSADHNIAEIAAGTPDVSTVTRLVVTAGLLPTVRDGGPFTVLAPINEAFQEVPDETMRALRADRAAQADLILLHVFPGTLTTDDFKAADGTSIETAQGGSLLVEVDGDEITVGGATIVLPDVAASNGMVHAVDAVIAEPNG